MAALLYSVALLAAFALFVGGLVTIMRRRDARRGWLMVLAALVLLANIAIWIVPFAPAAG